MAHRGGRGEKERKGWGGGGGGGGERNTERSYVAYGGREGRVKLTKMTRHLLFVFALPSSLRRPTDRPTDRPTNDATPWNRLLPKNFKAVLVLGKTPI